MTRPDPAAALREVWSDWPALLVRLCDILQSCEEGSDSGRITIVKLPGRWAVVTEDNGGPVLFTTDGKEQTGSIYLHDDAEEFEAEIRAALDRWRTVLRRREEGV